MSGSAGAAPPTAVLGLGLDIGAVPWHRRAVQRSRALVQTYLLTGSLHPAPAAAGGGAGGAGGGGGGRSSRAPLRLPSLTAAAKGPRRGSSMARLSFSEPALLDLNENVQFERFDRRVLQKRPPPPPPPSLSKSSALLPWKTCHPSGGSQQVRSCSRPTYIHFSQAIQPSSRPGPARRHSHNPSLSADSGNLRPLAAQCQGEPLSVIGKPCLPSCSQRPAPASAAAAAGPTRTHLHVFLPTEAGGGEVDSESVDEGFMDELDSKITSLKLQHGAPKMVT